MGIGPRMSAEDAEEWTQSLAQVGAGWWRQVALAVKQGVPAALGLSLDEWREDRLGGLVLKSIPERREAVAELTAEGFSKSQIAAVLGVDERTVQRDRNPRKTDVFPGDEDRETVSSQGETSAPPSGEDLDDAPLWEEPEPASGPAPLERQWDAVEKDMASAAAQLREAFETLNNEPSRPRVEVNEGDEWYTPRWLFDALGLKFSIDVCSPMDRTHVAVPAEDWFTVEDDGLAQPWHGTVWCNPPYSKPEPWARRMIHHRDGLLLTHMPMNAGWCVDVWEVCDAIRLFQAMEFVRPDGSVQRPGYWLQLAAFGPVATEALARLQPLGDAAANKRRVASPMWRPVA